MIIGEIEALPPVVFKLSIFPPSFLNRNRGENDRGGSQKNHTPASCYRGSWLLQRSRLLFLPIPFPRFSGGCNKPTSHNFAVDISLLSNRLCLMVSVYRGPSCVQLNSKFGWVSSPAICPVIALGEYTLLLNCLAGISKMSSDFPEVWYP